jgi:hypothetical protein
MLDNLRLIHSINRIRRQGQGVRLPKRQKDILKLFIVKEGS